MCNTVVIDPLHDLPSTVASEVAYLASRHLAVYWAEKLHELCFESLPLKRNLLFVRMEFEDMLSLLIILSDVLC